MGRSTSRRSGALLTTAAMVAGLTLAAAAPASAAPECTYTFPDEGGTYPQDQMKSGDILCGGPGDDIVNYMTGGVFFGGPGDDGVGEKTGGRFWGNVGDDWVEVHTGGTFVGGFGSDAIFALIGGTFDAGPGHDEVENGLGGSYLGGPGSDIAYIIADSPYVSSRISTAGVPAAFADLFPRGLKTSAVKPAVVELPDDLEGTDFRGGLGRDGVFMLMDGDFRGGIGADLTVFVDGGTFRGGVHSDMVYEVHSGLFAGGPGHDWVLWQAGGRYLGNRGNDGLGDVAEDAGLAGGFFNGGPGNDDAYICDDAIGASTKSVETETEILCD